MDDKPLPGHLIQNTNGKTTGHTGLKWSINKILLDCQVNDVIIFDAIECVEISIDGNDLSSDQSKYLIYIKPSPQVNVNNHWIQEQISTLT